MNMLADFSELAPAYDAGRRGYPDPVVDMVAQEVRRKVRKKQLVLDLGAGTGIAFGELKRRGVPMIGCDISYPMVSSPLAYSRMGRRAVVGAAASLPFASEVFTSGVSFGAFHWFSDRGSCTEIGRVVARGGCFCVVHKTYEDDLSHAVSSLFERYTGALSGKSDYNPVGALASCGFGPIKVANFPCQETYSIEELVAYYRSVSRWRLVKSCDREPFLYELCELAHRERTGSLVVRDLDISIVVAAKPK